MSDRPGDSGGDARGLALISTAVGQMVVPILLGVWLDNRNGWGPWGLIVGSIVGVGGMFVTLMLIARKQNRSGGRPPTV